jgi:hypothetical protein
VADRVALITSCVDVASMQGLEIGALHHPLVPPGSGNVRYVDHLPTEALRAKYSTDVSGEDVAATLVDVDFVWSPGVRLREVVGDWAPVDYVIASHVIEHIANPIDWLEQMAEVLADGGVLCLAIPDKRVSFDARRPVSTLGQLIDASMRSVSMTTHQQIFDFCSSYLANADIRALWDGMDPRSVPRTDMDSPAQYAYSVCLAQQENGAYVDVHANTFTPESFVDILLGLAEIGRLGFAVADFHPTRRPTNEFYVSLEKLPDGLEPSERRARQHAGFALCETRLRRAHRVLPPRTSPLLRAKWRARRTVRRRLGVVKRRLASRGTGGVS